MKRQSWFFGIKFTSSFTDNKPLVAFVFMGLFETLLTADGDIDVATAHADRVSIQSEFMIFGFHLESGIFESYLIT